MIYLYEALNINVNIFNNKKYLSNKKLFSVYFTSKNTKNLFNSLPVTNSTRNTNILSKQTS